MRPSLGVAVGSLFVGIAGSAAPTQAQTAAFPAPSASANAPGAAAAPAAPEPAPAELPAPPTVPPPTASASPPAAAPAPALPAPAASLPAPAAPVVAANPSTPAAPPAANEPKFGEERELMFTGALSASVGHQSYSNSNASGTSFSFAPSADYFLGRNLFVGAAVFLQYSKSTTGLPVAVETVRYGVSGRLGWNAWLGDTFSLLPTLSLGEWNEHSSYAAAREGFTTSVGGTAVNVGSDVTQTVVFVGVFAPLLFHPTPHFFLGLGPEAYVDVLHDIANQAGGTTSNPRMFVGLSSVVGGWLDPR